MPETSDSNSWERHGQSLVAGVLLILLSWVGYTVNENSKKAAVMEIKVESLVQQLYEVRKQLSSGLDDRYRGTDARRDLSAVYDILTSQAQRIDSFGNEQARRGPRIATLEEEVKSLKSRVKDLEKK